MKQFYKPNPSVKGHACSFDFTSNGESAGLYLELVKQVSWDAKTKTGKFLGGEKVKLKFNDIEMGRFIDCIRNNRPAKMFHSSAAGKTGINFEPYISKKDNTQIGFSLSVRQGEKSFLLGFDYAEAIVIENFLENCLDHMFTAAYSEKKKRLKNKAKQLEESPLPY